MAPFKLSGFARLLIAIVIAGLLSYWLGIIKRSWEEEVRLSDGRVIVIARSVSVQKFGSKQQAESHGPVILQKLRFAGTTEQVAWEDDITPIIFEIKGPNYFVVAMPGSDEKCKEHGNPNPPFVFYKYADGRWETIPYSEFPDGFQRNLLVDFWRPETANGGRLTMPMKDQGDRFPGQIRVFDKAMRLECNFH